MAQFLFLVIPKVQGLHFFYHPSYCDRDGKVNADEQGDYKSSLCILYR